MNGNRGRPVCPRPVCPRCPPTVCPNPPACPTAPACQCPEPPSCYCGHKDLLTDIKTHFSSAPLDTVLGHLTTLASQIEGLNSRIEVLNLEDQKEGVLHEETIKVMERVNHELQSTLRALMEVSTQNVLMKSSIFLDIF